MPDVGRPIVDISINLLPETQSNKNKSFGYLLPVIGSLAILFATVFLIYNYLNTKDSVEVLSGSITRETETRDQLIAEYQQLSSGITEYNYVDKYRDMHLFLDNVYVNTIGMHSNILRLLPEGAQLNGYSYINNGDLLMTITFFSKGDSAIYLHQLLSADFVDHAEVQVISTDSEDLMYESVFQIKLNTIVGEEE